MSMVLGPSMIFLMIENKIVYKVGIVDMVGMVVYRIVVIYIEVLDNERTVGLYMTLLFFLFYGDFPLFHQSLY